MAEIKQIFLIVNIGIMFLICIVGSTYSSPAETIKTEVITQHSLQTVVDLIDEQEYKKAFNNLEQISNLDYCLLKYNKQKFTTLLNEYKEILIEEANNHTNNGDYVFALNLLNSKHKYYKNDENINLLIKYNTQQIQKLNLVEYNGKIEHLTTNCLLAFPEKALNTNNPLHETFDKNYLTPIEFEKILFSLYSNNYVLVSPESVFVNTNGNIKQNTLWLPSNKKPLILSFSNCSYVGNTKNKGLIDKIILDRNGNLATFTSKQKIAERVSYDNEFITILESFVKTYPEFSFNGAKGLICLNGQNGILGYKTQRSNATSRYEIKKALQVISKLKNLGWTFACSGYTDENLEKLSDVEFSKVISNWVNEVEPIVGKTKIFVSNCNFNALNTQNDANLSYKQQLLVDYGFELFCQIGSNLNQSYNNIMVMEQQRLSGETLRTVNFSNLFANEQVYDHTNRTKPFKH